MHLPNHWYRQDEDNDICQKITDAEADVTDIVVSTPVQVCVKAVPPGREMIPA